MLQEKEKGAFHDLYGSKPFPRCLYFLWQKAEIKKVVYHKKAFSSDKNSFLQEKI